MSIEALKPQNIIQNTEQDHNYMASKAGPKKDLDQQDFMKVMIETMKNQNPFNNDGNSIDQFFQQLSSMKNIEEMQDLNTNIKSMNYLGKDVELKAERVDNSETPLPSARGKVLEVRKTAEGTKLLVEGAGLYSMSSVKAVHTPGSTSPINETSICNLSNNNS